MKKHVVENVDKTNRRSAAKMVKQQIHIGDLQSTKNTEEKRECKKQDGSNQWNVTETEWETW